MPLIVNDIPATLPPPVAAALAAVALDRASLNDDTADWATFGTALAAAVTANQITQNAATMLANAYGGGPTGPIDVGADDVPATLPPALSAAVQALAVVRSGLGDEKAAAAALLAAAQAAVGANQVTKDAATDLLAVYGVTYADAAPPPAGP